VVDAVKIKIGNVVEFGGALWKVLDTQQTFTGKHGAYMQLKMKRLSDGHTETRRFSSSDNLERAFLEARTMEYLYADGTHYVFMDPDTGDQITVDGDDLRHVIPYLSYNARVNATFHEGHPIEVQLPASVVLEVTHTEPAVRGDTATTVTKPAQLETGLQVRVPGHVKTGDKVKVDTRTGEFLGRA